MGNSNSKKAMGISLVAVLLIAMVILLISKVFGGSDGQKETDHDTLPELIKEVKYETKTPVKGSVDLSNASLYDELPAIDKYPLSLDDKSGEVKLEVFASPEKAGEGADSWMVDIAKQYNKSKPTVDGKTVSVSVRNISSGVAADYIISGKYIPTAFSPSSDLWGSYVEAQGGHLQMVNESVVGNVAGFLVSKKSDYKSYKDIIAAVQKGEINVGYTNPQVSTTGMNLLMTILKDNGNGDISSDAAVSAFTSFQKNIPYVATNTMQMRDSSASGSLDGMTMEYQSYVQDSELKSTYNFVPFGVRHDNPIYVCSKATDIEKKALDNFVAFCKSPSSQKAATAKGFNNNPDYKNDAKFTGKEVKDALTIYKREKDSGKSIIAVFVADVSGSMAGEPLQQLKQSITNGMKYINDTNYVGLVSYSSDVSIEVPIARFDLNQKSYFQGAIDGMAAGGNTASYDALVVAMDMIEKAKKDYPDAKPMLFLLSDGQANEGFTLGTIKGALKTQKTPVYTISYGDEADTKAMNEVASVNEAASIVADSNDIVYKIKGLFNSSL